VRDTGPVDPNLLTWSL